MNNEMYIYALLDVTSGEYGIPMMFCNNEVARRHVKMFMNDKESVVAQFPNDFKLYKLAIYDTDLGKIESLKPECLGNLTQLNAE